jgi:hypothetical protein
MYPNEARLRNMTYGITIHYDVEIEFIKLLESKAGIPDCKLMQINKSGKYIVSWIHPKLAIQLSQWISYDFCLQVSDWIFDLFTIQNVNMDINTIKDKKIKLLENLCVKKHKRQEYPGKYVIYMLTTEDHKKNGIYIIGKAIDLKDRLGTYNKTCDHEVVYYKECKSEEEMDLIEKNVLLKLSKYKEVANRDRFILPIENDISLFTNSIDNAIKFFD